VKAKGFKEINERIVVQANNISFTYEMISEDIKIPQVSIVAFDIET
jgi:hypothetical protein